ncbi:MAG: PSD1 and planctomycete cytochrome C domain-containing protein, partial [Pirellulaceae bacterium]
MGTRNASAMASAAMACVCLALTCLALACEADVSAADREESERLFARRVWPLLQARCLACHGDKAEGGLDLRTAESAGRGGDSGLPAIVPGQPEASPLWRAAQRTDEEFSAMPPKDTDRLSDEELQLLRNWLAGSASWPDAARREKLAAAASDWNSGDGVQVATSGGLTPEWTSRRYRPEQLWAYRPVHKSPIPAGAEHPIDAFLAERLRAAGITPAGRADRPTLIRRVTFDLTGLPPTPDEVADFLGDPAPDRLAFARVVDRLLASPHYGEHWGRHWLDVVRYADSSGFANDYERGNAWRYRDYVVRAFNSDKPFDEFVREQIAGDELRPDDPEMAVAVGFLRMGPWELTGMEVARIARQRFLDDVTDSVGQVFLAHPLQCARCHDHKFDPIPTRDYYALQAIFATTQLAERAAPFLPQENTSGFGERSKLEQRRTQFEQALSELNAKETEAARRWCAERGLPYVPRNQGLKQGIPEDRLPPRHVGFSVEDYGMERIARKGLERLKWELERYEPFALSVYGGRTPELRSVNAPLRVPARPDAQGELEKTAVLAGGDPFSPLDRVTPGPLSAIESLGQMASREFATLDSASLAGRRTALAQWLTRRDHPLTARVFVNRVWQWHFGQGLVASANNFGAMGKKPAHPALLDWLAAEWMDGGWSVKSLHRWILSSDAYCRSSEHPQRDSVLAADPPGDLYAVFRVRRLTAEEIRDSQLAVTGELNRDVGGIPVRPAINPEAALQPRQVMGTFASAWQPSPLPSQRNRRSLYALRLRGLRDPFLEVFNEPSPELSCEGREASLISPQVFSLFNSEASYARALAFAARLARETSTPAEAIDRAFRLAFGRPATAEEVAACRRHAEIMRTYHAEPRWQVGR